MPSSNPATVEAYKQYLALTGSPEAAATLVLADAQPPAAEFLALSEVGAMLGISPRSVRRRVDDGTFPPPIKIGRLSKWRRLDIENYQGSYS